MTKTNGTQTRCYGRVHGPNWCQEWYETASRDAARRGRELRAAGYIANVSAMGTQVTNVGYVKMTLVDIRPGANPDTTEIPTTHTLLVRGV
jgi:hypothetical protein